MLYFPDESDNLVNLTIFNLSLLDRAWVLLNPDDSFKLWGFFIAS